MDSNNYIQLFITKASILCDEYIQKERAAVTNKLLTYLVQTL